MDRWMSCYSCPKHGLQINMINIMDLALAFQYLVKIYMYVLYLPVAVWSPNCSFKLSTKFHKNKVKHNQ